MTRLGPLVLAVLCLACTRLLSRSDDAFEPNDDLEHASSLTAGQTIKARANQGNADVFSLEAPEGKRVLFRLESVGLENCPAFIVTGPDRQVLFRDHPYSCHRGRDGQSQPAQSVEGAALTPAPRSGYELRVPAARAGKYSLTIDEQREADNMFPLSWDYQLTADLE